MTSSLVGSEMCIRDRLKQGERLVNASLEGDKEDDKKDKKSKRRSKKKTCLLYTSDAADDM
eukprot:8074326-Prorocentrum_lima.AAC.1